MKFYLFSPLKALLTVNGEPKATIGKNLTAFSAENVFLCVTPVKGFAQCRAYSENADFDENFLRFSLLDGTLLIPEFLPALKRQKRTLCSTTVTSFGYEFNISAVTDVFTKLQILGYRERLESTLSFEPQSVSAVKRGDMLVVFSHGRVKNVSVFTVNPLKRIFSADCASYSLEEDLSLEFLTRGVALYKRSEHYSFKNGFHLLGSDVRYDRHLSVLPSPLLKATAFFELMSLGGDLSPFLSVGLRSRAEQIAEFAGKFRFALSLSVLGEKYLFALVGDKVKYARVFVENGLICDVDIDETYL